MSYVNLVKNGSFENDLNFWTHHQTEAENLIEIDNTNAYDGTKCAKLSTTKAGQCRLQQTLKLIGGKTYTLSFYAKRTDTIDVWVSYFPNGGSWVPCPSRRNEITGTYQRIDQEICVNAAGVIDVVIAIIAGSKPGIAWIDNITLMEDQRIADIGTEPIQIANGSFDDGATGWNKSSNVSIAHSPVTSSTSALFTTPATSNLYFGSISQNLNLKRGGFYRIRYSVIRNYGPGRVQSNIVYTNKDGIDCWITGGHYSDLPGITSQIDFSFTLPADAQSNSVTFTISAMCDAGYASQIIVDDIQLRGPSATDEDSGETTEQTTSNGLRANRYVKVIQDDLLNVRKEPSVSSNRLGRLVKDTVLVCCGIEDNDWVKVFWGGTTDRYAYLKAEYLEDCGALDADLAIRAKKIAISMLHPTNPTSEHVHPAENNPSNLGLGVTQEDGSFGSWCVLFCTWLMRAAGCAVFPPVDGTCDNVSEAKQYFDNHHEFTQTPHIGDWVFYSKPNSDISNPKDYYAHVGMVVDVNHNTQQIYTVEGNLSQAVKTHGWYDYHDGVSTNSNNLTVLGFGQPSWI